MIKLTVNPETNPCLHSYEKTSIVIGLGGDLSLPGEDLKPAHVKIFQQENRFFILNLANDPFVTLNQHPFGKKILHDGDLITIGNTPIRFNANATIHSAPLVDTEEKLNHILAKAISTPQGEKKEAEDPSTLTAAIDPDIEIEKLEELASAYINNWNEPETSDDVDVEALLQEVEELEKLEHAPLPPPYAQTIKIREGSSHAENMYQKGSLKDYYLRELEDEQEQTNQTSDGFLKSKGTSSGWNFKYVGIILMIVIIITATTLSIFYFSASDKNSEDELKAAGGVADVAMALVYAQVNHGKPQNLNWSDPEFIKNNLLSTLAPKYNPIDNLDSHGQFTDNSYFIRIYTSSDLSHFLVIAQPSPSILQWLIPRASIIVDSRQMEMRRIEDLKNLNRILLNPNMLDDANHHEVSLLIQKGELIPLSSIAKKAEQNGFSPPKILRSIRPGAENLIYNAPRYYPFGESFLKKAVLLSKNQGTSHEVALLQNQLRSLEKYPNIILYSPQGMQKAVQAQKALNTFFPNNKFLVAYLRLNLKGLIVSSNLLIPDNSNEVAVVAPSEESALNEELPPLLNPQDVKIGDVTLTNPPRDLDTTHPLLLKLCALQADRQHLEKDFEMQLASLLDENKENHTAIQEFLNRLELLLKKSLNAYKPDDEKFQKTNAAAQFLTRLNVLLKTKQEKSNLEEQVLIKSLTKLYEDYGDMPLADFMHYIKLAGFETFVNKHLKLINESSVEEELPLQKEIETQIAKIKESSNLAELSKDIEIIAQSLNLEKFPHPSKVIAYQAQAKAEVLDKLNDFLLSNENGLPDKDFNEENRALIEQIMKTAWVTNPEELDFYLNEFDNRRANPKTPERAPNQ